MYLFHVLHIAHQVLHLDLPLDSYVLHIASCTVHNTNGILDHKSYRTHTACRRLHIAVQAAYCMFGSTWCTFSTSYHYILQATQYIFHMHIQVQGRSHIDEFCVYVGACTDTHINTYTHICIYTYTHTQFIFVRIYIYIHLNLYLYIYLHVYIYIKHTQRAYTHA